MADRQRGFKSLKINLEVTLENGITVLFCEDETVCLKDGINVWSADKKGNFTLQKLTWQEKSGNIVCPACGFSCDDEYYLDKKNYCPDCGTRLNWGNENESTNTD